MKKVVIRDEKGQEFKIKITKKYIEVEGSYMPNTVCDRCLHKITAEENIKKGRNFIIVAMIVYMRQYYFRAPYLKCDICEKRTATLKFVGLIHYDEGQWFYLSKAKNFEKQPFEKVFKKSI